MSIKQIVIDASVALKWRLQDEECIEQADLLLGDFVAKKLQLLTPTIFDYEITNVFKVATLKGRIEKADATQAVKDFQAFGIKRYAFDKVQLLALELAYRYQRSVYDSAYLALAQSQNLWLFTGDKRLFNAVHVALPFVKWIGDYQFTDVP